MDKMFTQDLTNVSTDIKTFMYTKYNRNLYYYFITSIKKNTKYKSLCGEISLVN
jgi:hypothetical protein